MWVHRRHDDSPSAARALEETVVIERASTKAEVFDSSRAVTCAGEADPFAELDRRTREGVAATQRASYAAAGHAAYVIQRSLRLTSKPLYGAAYAQALTTWWTQRPSRFAPSACSPNTAPAENYIHARQAG
ncbi:hypothetical protein [Nonomuraea sediminis]|uniref:hypothetical protein n=1 Tax=Nonomuraea sediminis TaxID=2835864 RepID=UPI001BDC2EBC|nr:hypothetical protein [Nonomuraea sediminis]